MFAFGRIGRSERVEHSRCAGRVDADIGGTAGDDGLREQQAVLLLMPFRRFVGRDMLTVLWLAGFLPGERRARWCDVKRFCDDVREATEDANVPRASVYVLQCVHECVCVS